MSQDQYDRDNPTEQYRDPTDVTGHRHRDTSGFFDQAGRAVTAT
jgi:hypothetical protein